MRALAPRGGLDSVFGIMRFRRIYNVKKLLAVPFVSKNELKVNGLMNPFWLNPVYRFT
jgi:hypothetical protein